MFIKQFEVLLGSRSPIIYVWTLEENRVDNVICRTLINLNKSYQIYEWDYIEGFKNKRNLSYVKKNNPMEALAYINEFPLDQPAAFLLKDFQKFIGDLRIARKLRNIIRDQKSIKTSNKPVIIIIAPELVLPTDLIDIISIIEFPLPNYDEIRTEILRLFWFVDTILTDDPNFIDIFVRACQGLTMDRIRAIFSKAIFYNKSIDASVIRLILNEKREIIKQTEILEFPDIGNVSFKDIGGLSNLKQWLRVRKNAFGLKAKNYGLSTPQGLLLVGIQGTGKSLSAKVIANEWQLPLLRLDVGRLFGGLIGESETRIRTMIQLAESLSPCVLWIDEIDKAFSENTKNGDSGTTTRVFGTFITWLSEKTTEVFVVATANQISSLPLELVRKGRFDEIFFIDLPNLNDRQQIFYVILNRLRPKKIDNFNLFELSKKAEYFSGAEIEQAVTVAMLCAFSEGRDFSQQDILLGLEEIIPLYKMDPERMNQIQSWGHSGRLRLAS
nr:Ycf46 [Meringosphaera mediterranea]